MHDRTTINLYAPLATSLHSLRTGKRNPETTGEIHQSFGIIRLSQLLQSRQIIAVEILHSLRIRVRKRRVDEQWEIFRGGTFFKDLCPEFVQGRLQGIDPVLVVGLVLPGEICNDGAVRLAFHMREGRVCRMVKHGRGEWPQPDGDTGASVLLKSFGNFIRLPLDLIDDTRGELVDHNVAPPTTWKPTNAGHWRPGTILKGYV